MIKQPNIRTIAALLRAEFEASGVNLGTQKSLNVAATVLGYKNWAHFQRIDGKKASEAPVPPETPVTSLDTSKTVEELVSALDWVLRNYLTTLGGKSVRDADECVVYANNLLERFRKSSQEDSFMRSERIKNEYLDSGCQASDVDYAVTQLMRTCSDLFESPTQAWEFLMEELHEDSETE